ncbi:hypothetical protein IFR05_014680 [Cadophora sp. M221]|nr:hypothetical protein IFR05_014680 [Cadophora sp. M221]
MASQNNQLIAIDATKKAKAPITFMGLPLEIRYMIYSYTTYNRTINIPCFSTSSRRTCHYQETTCNQTQYCTSNTDLLLPLRLTYSIINIEITTWLRAAPDIRSLSFAGNFHLGSVVFVIDATTSSAQAQSALLSNSVFKECVSDVIVDWGKHAGAIDVGWKLGHLPLRLLEDVNEHGKGLSRVRLRSKVWLPDEKEKDVMNYLRLEWDLSRCKSTCAVDPSNENNQKQGGCEKRWPRIEWSFNGEKTSIARREWKVLPGLSAGAWRLAMRHTPLHLDLYYHFGLVSDGLEVSDEEKYLIKRFRRRGWLDTDEDRLFMERCRREEAVRRRPGSGRTFFGRPRWSELEIRFGIAAIAEAEEAKDEGIRIARAFKKLKAAQQAQMRAKRRNIRK